MQNKPNFQDAKMNVSNIITRNYKIFIPLAGYKNKPNSNPIRQACVVCEGVAGLIKPNFKRDAGFSPQVRLGTPYGGVPGTAYYTRHCQGPQLSCLHKGWSDNMIGALI